MFVLPTDTPTPRRSWRGAKLSDLPRDFLEQVTRHRDSHSRRRHAGHRPASHGGNRAPAALRGTGTAHVVPVINMVDDSNLKAAAGDAARQALSLTNRFERVVLVRMIADDPIDAVVGSGVSSRSHTVS